MIDSEYFRKRRIRLSSEKRCTRCGNQDKLTLSSRSTCKKCLDSIKKRYREKILKEIEENGKHNE